MNFEETITTYRQRVNQALADFLDQVLREFPSPHALIADEYRLIRDYILRGGKRLRPIATLMAYRAVGGLDEREVYLPAIGMELFHNHTLIHDDIYDEDSERRGHPAVHTLLQRRFRQDFLPHSSLLFKDTASRFGVVGGIISGKMTHALAILALLQAPVSDEVKVQLLELCARQTLLDNIGQAFDLALEGAEAIEQHYLDMVYYKTGALFKTCVEIGALIGGGTPAQRQALVEYMVRAALAFQIQDDLIDIGVGRGKGRELGTDIRKGKRTLLVIRALQNADRGQRETLRYALGNLAASSSDVATAIEVLFDTGAVDFCIQKARQQVEQAKGFLRSARPELTSQGVVFFDAYADFVAGT